MFVAGDRGGERRRLHALLRQVPRERDAREDSDGGSGAASRPQRTVSRTSLVAAGCTTQQCINTMCQQYTVLCRHRDRYAQLLADCHALYFSHRLSLLGASVTNAVRDLATKHARDHCALVSHTLLFHLRLKSQLRRNLRPPPPCRNVVKSYFILLFFFESF